jgi:hypothetical protein
MQILYKNSLAKTVDALNTALFFGISLSQQEKSETGDWIAGRQGKKLAYAKMFAPTEYDFKHGIRVFTGERVVSNAAIGHVLGEETCRVLRLLKSPKRAIKDALQRASRGINRRLVESGRFQKSGIFCCGMCTVSMWRNMTSGGLKPHRGYLNKGLASLSKYRDGKGRWRIFPFYYTLLVLSDIGSRAARKELRYAGPVIERLITRQGNGKYGERRKRLMEDILEMI